MHQRILTLLAYAAFVALGLPDTVLGVAWPQLRAGFQLPPSAMGIVLLAGTCGYFCSGLLAGTLTRRLGIGGVLTLSSGLVALSLLGYAAAPSWKLFFPIGVFVGLGSGAVDAALNDYAARHFSARSVNWLHAFWGIGASLGPTIMTAAIVHGQGYRGGYAYLATGLATMSLAFAVTRGGWNERTRFGVPHCKAASTSSAASGFREIPSNSASHDLQNDALYHDAVSRLSSSDAHRDGPPRPAACDAQHDAHLNSTACDAHDDARSNSAPDDAHHDEPTQIRPGAVDALRSRSVWLHILVFALYTGFEASVGQWCFTWMRDVHRLDTALAGYLTAAYWACLTLGRFVLGAIVGRVGPERLLRLCGIAAILATLLFASTTGSSSRVGLLALGLALAPFFPTLMARTPARVGADLARYSVGFQVSAATLGASLAPAGIGLLVSSVGSGIIGGALLVLGVTFAAAHESLNVLCARRVPA